MKKLKKLLAGVLTLAMAMSMMTMTAFAAPDDESGKSTNTIVSGTQGSITIHKYNYNGNAGVAGTGSEKDKDEVPSDAVELPNVEFTIYKVVDEATLLKYYNGDNGVYDGTYDPKIFMTGGEADSDKFLFDAENPGAQYTKSETTASEGDDIGVAKFEGLDIGIYLVVETKHPDSVSSPADPFLVSIPLTVNTKDGEGNVTGSEWLYDVHVYPKNATDSMTEDIVLIKYGKEAGATNKSELNGVNFILQKATVVDGEVTGWTTITHQSSASKDDDETQPALNLTTSKQTVFGEERDGVIRVTGLSAGKYRFLEKDLGTNDSDQGYIIDGSTNYIFDIERVTNEETGKTSLVVKYSSAHGIAGVKVVNANGALVDSATEDFDGDKNVHFEVVNEKPKFEKSIVNKDGTTTEGEDNNAEYGVGDTVPYEVKIGVPTQITKMKTFYLEDNPSHLAVVDNTIKVYKPDGTEMTSGFTITNGTAAADGSKGFRIDFAMAADAEAAKTEIQGLGGQEITVKYSAVMLAAAEGNTDPTTNKAELSYSDRVRHDGDDLDNPDEGEEINKRQDQEVSNLYKFKVIKYDGKVGDDTLDGVEFDLYREVSNAIEGKTITGDDAKALGLASDKHWLKVNSKKLVTVDGVVTQGELANGIYYLVETKTKDGYNLLEEPLEVTLSIQSTTTVTKKWTQKNVTDGDGKVREYGAWVEECTIETTYANDGDATADGIFDQPVINRKGFTLPSTGGMGTFLFTFVGVAMMAAAVILFFTSKKKEAK